MTRSMARMVGALALVAALTLGSTVTPSPAGANPSDVYLPKNTLSIRYDLGVCRYKVYWGNFGTPYARIHVYNLTACGSIAVVVFYVNGTTSGNGASTTVEATGSDGCGAYSVIQANAPAGTATRALVFTSTDSRYYDTDGTAVQGGTIC